jgi:RNA polymerase sigma-70 factor (ECF subfamily)
MSKLSNCEDDEYLLQAIRAGDEDAFKEIFTRYWSILYKSAMIKLHVHAEAEEIVQNIFTTLWEKRGTLQITNLSFYLKVSVRNRVLNSIRSKVTQQKYWEYYGNFLPRAKDYVDDAIFFNELNETVEQVVNTLPLKSQQVFRLNRLEGFSVPEIADQLKLSEKAIEYHLTKSLKVLRLHLKDLILLISLFSGVFE